MGVVVACAAQVPPSAPVADHPAHDDRLRGRWLALRQPHTPTSPKRASCTGRPTPVGGAHRAGPDTVGTRPPTKPGGRSSSFATHSRAIGRAWPVRGTRWWARPSSPHIPTQTGSENRYTSLPVTPDNDRKGCPFHVGSTWHISAAAGEGVDAIQHRGWRPDPRGKRAGPPRD